MSETYALNAAGGVIRGSDQASIPNDPGNADWREYQTWVSAGNTATPYTAPAPVYTCQLWQLQAVLTSEQWTQVQSAVTALNSPTISAYYAHGTNPIPSNSTTLLSIGESIGLTSAQIVALVQSASQVSIP
jgi:hypothetical protein